MGQTFTDRYGQCHVPPDKMSIVARQGAWLVCVHHGRVLLNHPYYAPDVPDLPGGGIDAGETARQAAMREFNEETGMILQKPQFGPAFKQQVDFYAEDVPAYWHYEQTFFLMDDGLKNVFFEGVKQTPEGHSAWIPLSRLHEYQIHHFHQQALVYFGLMGAKAKITTMAKT